MPNVTTWLAAFDQLAANPGDIQTLALQQVEESYAGTADLGDPTYPFINLVEASSIHTAGALRAYDTYTRRTYGNLSQTMDDLYVHMSDVDYLNRFAIPSSATFNLLYSTEELLASMVDTGVNGIKELIIPRNTSITVSEVTFTMQYPILIRQMAHGGLQIVYDNSVISPLETLSSNKVQWQAVTLSSDQGPLKCIMLSIPIQQMAITSYIAKVNYSAGLTQVYSYSDQFYYCRAYSIDNSGNATEILTTHTDQNFDPTQPTLLLQDLGGSLRVSLPQIYLTNRAVGGEIQVDIYTTQGDIELSLAQYTPQSFVITYSGASTADTPYVAPLTTFKTYTLYSIDTTAGGSDGLSFDDLRTQVLENNFGAPVPPITPTQLSSVIQKLGYQSVINVDDVTDRIVLATRALPAPSDGSTQSGAAMSIETLVASFDDLSTLSSVVVNGDRATILPTTVYTLTNGLLAPVTDAALASLNALPAETRVEAINSATYLYSPFHYVMDSEGSTFALRPYFLDNPLIKVIQFVMQNETVGMSVSTDEKELIRTADGYRLRLTCTSSTEWKQLPDDRVFCQLAFIPTGEHTYAYMNGTQIGLTDANERIFEFDLSTNYDIDSNDNLLLTTFQMFNDTVRPHATALTTDFDIFWIAQGVSDSDTTTTQIDEDMGTELLPSDCLGIDRERLTVVLGSALPNLWHRSRSVAGSGTYQTYSADVIETYSENVYKTDPTTGLTVITKNDDGTIAFTLLHAAGDQVLDADNNPIIAHHAGDKVLDSDGNPIVVSEGTVQHQMDMLMIEGVYFFANSPAATSYKGTLAALIANWITQELAPLVPELLEKTELYYYPQAALGNVDVLIQNGGIVSIPAPQTFVVTYYLDGAGYADASLQAPLQDTAIDVLTSALANQQVTMTTITSTLKEAVSGDVVSFDIVGLGGDLALTTLTVVDNANRLSLRKVAVVEPDGTVGVQDGVTCAFRLHDPSISTTLSAS